LKRYNSDAPALGKHLTSGQRWPGKTGQRSGRSRSDVFYRVLAGRASDAPITVFAEAMAEALQEAAIISLAVGLKGYPDSAPHRERGS
jgi:hypothetical protein